jgi:hypothetical protein
VRGRLLREGGLTAKQFANWNLGTNFTPLTLDEMKAREPEVFDRVAGGATEDKKDLHSGAGGSILNAGEAPAKTGVAVIDEALEKTNPTGDMQNCGPCAIAYEMQRRGNDVEALPGREMRLHEFKNYFEDFKWVDAAAKTSAEALEAATKQIESWGDGARGMVFGVRLNKDYGHYFSFEVYDGHIYFVDSQTGDGKAEWHFNTMYPDTMKAARLDTLKPKTGINHLIKGKVE